MSFSFLLQAYPGSKGRGIDPTSQWGSVNVPSKENGGMAAIAAGVYEGSPEKQNQLEMD